LRDGAPIAGATSNTYLVERVDQGHLLSCIVTATNVEGRVEAESTNGAAVPFSTQPPPGNGGNGGGSRFAPTVPQILDAMSKQLVKSLGNLRIGSVVKSGGVTFAFVAPTVGTLEVVWYVYVMGAHKKATKVIVAEAKMPFAKALAKASVRVRLTSKGRAALAHRKQFKVTAKAVFTVAHGASVPWLEPILLRH
jgi:hypothetical protein